MSYCLILLYVLTFFNDTSYCAEAPPNDPVQELHRAVERKETEKAATLLNENQDIVDTPLGHLTPLHKAARHQHHLMIKLLVDEYDAFIDPLDDTGSTPLHLTFTPDHAIETIVEIPGSHPVPNGRIAIKRMAAGNIKNIVRYLVFHDAAIYLQKNDGQTPLDLAANHPEASTKMLEVYAERHNIITTGIMDAYDSFSSDTMFEKHDKGLPVVLVELLAEFTQGK